MQYEAAGFQDCTQRCAWEQVGIFFRRWLNPTMHQIFSDNRKNVFPGFPTWRPEMCSSSSPDTRTHRPGWRFFQPHPALAGQTHGWTARQSALRPRTYTTKPWLTPHTSTRLQRLVKSPRSFQPAENEPCSSPAKQNISRLQRGCGVSVSSVSHSI